MGFLQRRVSMASLAIFMTLMILAGCSSQPTATPQGAGSQQPSATASVKDKLVIGLGTNVATADNHKVTGLPAIGVNSQMADVLVRLDEKGNVIPWLAEKWEEADGGKSLILKIRDNVKMHDGNTLTAEDVRYSIERFRKYSIGRSALAVVSSITTMDGNRVKITTKAPFAPLLRTLTYTTIGIYSKAAIEKVGDDNFGESAIGTGPYKLAEFKKGDRMVLEAFDDYWAGKPQFRQVIVRMMPEMSARVLALESGDVDLIDAISPHEANRMAGDPKLQIINPPSSGFVRLNFNTQKGPLTDKRVRKAIAYGIDREAIAQSIFKGMAPVAHSAVPEGAFGYTAEYDEYKYNPEKAKQLLKDAGVPNLTFKLYHSPGRYLLSTEVVEAVQAQLGQIGVKVEIVNMEWGAFSDIIRKPLAESETEAMFTWWRSINGDADSAIGDLASKFMVPQGNNVAMFKNAEFDRLYDAQQAEPDQAKRLEMLKQMQLVVMDEMPIAPLYQQPNLWAAKKGLKGVKISALSCLQPLHAATLTN